MNTLNLSMMLEFAARERPDSVFVTDGKSSRSYAAVQGEAERFAGALDALGVAPGARVVLLMPGNLDFFGCFFGALRLGAVPVVVHPASPGPEIAHILNDSRAEVLIFGESSRDAALVAVREAPHCRRLIMGRSTPGGDCPLGVLELAELRTESAPARAAWPSRATDPALILYTSGSTGRPKGAVRTHLSTYFFLDLLRRDHFRIGPDDVVLNAAPVSHIFGLILTSLACLARARLVVLERFEPDAFLGLIQQERVTFFGCVPTLAHLILNLPQLGRYDLDSLRRVMISGAPVSHESLEAIEQGLHLEVVTGYGMTEAIPITIANNFRDVPKGSVGRPGWGTSLRIVDETGANLPSDLPGEIWVRGAQVFAGYHRSGETDDSFTKDGWFRTGDIGRLDEDGYLYIVDRLRDMIKRHGYPVYPAEIERVLYTHPAVADAGVVGVPDPVTGEEVKAVVALKPGCHLTAEELIGYCRGQLAAYKCPRLVEFREQLPKSPAGKVLRRLLRQG